MNAPTPALRYRRWLPVSPDIADLIATVCPEGTGYRAPDAPQVVEAEDIVGPNATVAVWPNAWHLTTLETTQRAKRDYERRHPKTAAIANGRQLHQAPARVVKATLEVVTECGPLPLRELEIRMRRRGAGAKDVSRALRDLVEDGQVAWREVRIESGARLVVYERWGQP